MTSAVRARTLTSSHNIRQVYYCTSYTVLRGFSLWNHAYWNILIILPPKNEFFFFVFNKIRKNNVYRRKPQFYYIKVGSLFVMDLEIMKTPFSQTGGNIINNFTSDHKWDYRFRFHLEISVIHWNYKRNSHFHTTRPIHMRGSIGL